MRPPGTSAENGVSPAKLAPFCRAIVREAPVGEVSTSRGWGAVLSVASVVVTISVVAVVLAEAAEDAVCAVVPTACVLVVVCATAVLVVVRAAPAPPGGPPVASAYAP